jgi:hypothetical protein
MEDTVATKPSTSNGDNSDSRDVRTEADQAAGKADEAADKQPVTDPFAGRTPDTLPQEK